MDHEAVYSSGQVAWILGIAVETLRRMEKRGDIPPAWRSPGGLRRFTKRDIAGISEYLEGRLPAYRDNPEAWD